MKVWQAGLSLAAVMLLAGCSSPPEVIEPVAYNSSQSEALNKANQTYLTKPYKYGFKTISSPLKDFSEQEIEKVRTELTRPSGGTAPIVLGALNIATGKLIGIIDVAGGSAAVLAHSDHVAAQTQWIVALDAQEFHDGLSAKVHANNVIRETAIELLKEKGNTISKVYLREEGEASLTGASIAPVTAYVLNDELRLFGLYEDEYYTDKGEFKLGQTNLVPYEQQYVSVRESKIFGGVANFKNFLDGKVNGYQGLAGYEQFLLDLTRRLPKGYLLYIPSFPKATVTTVERTEDWSCLSCRSSQTYTLTSQIVPAVYTEGKKLEFIKP